MFRFIKTKIKSIKSRIQRPILRTGEYLDQIIVRSFLMFLNKMTKFVRVGLI